MPESFVTNAKQGGTCVVCGVTFAQGVPLHMQNLGDDVNKKWIVSPHDECFKKLQADPTIMQKNSKFPQKPKRTADERFNDAIAMLDKLWVVSKDKALKELPFLANSSNPQLDDNLRDRRILQATFLHNLTLEYTR